MSTFLSALERHLESWAEEKKETLEIAEIGHKAPKTKLGRQYGPLHDKMRKKSATIALKTLYYLPVKSLSSFLWHSVKFDQN